MLLLNKCHFFIYLFPVKIRLEKRFNNVLNTKQSCFGHKQLTISKSQNCIFPKGLTHAFGEKMPFFYLFVFGQNKTRNKV